MKRPTVGPPILRYLTDREGQLVHLGDMATALGFTPRQVQSGVRNLRNRVVGGLDLNKSIAPVIPGTSWIYRPVKVSEVAHATPPGGAKSSPRLFTELGVTSKGKLLIRCEDGVIYEAVEL